MPQFCARAEAPSRALPLAAAAEEAILLSRRPGVSCESRLKPPPALKEPTRERRRFARFAAPRVLFSGAPGRYRSPRPSPERI